MTVDRLIKRGDGISNLEVFECSKICFQSRLGFVSKILLLDRLC